MSTPLFARDHKPANHIDWQYDQYGDPRTLRGGRQRRVILVTAAQTIVLFMLVAVFVLSVMAAGGGP